MQGSRKKDYILADKGSRVEEKSEDMKEVVDSMMNGERKLVGLICS